MEITPGVIALIVALIGPVATYLVAAKQLSGKIKNSDASELWSESRAIREWSSDRIRELNQHVDELEKRLDTVEQSNRDLMEENRNLVSLLQKEKETVAQLKQEAKTHREDL